MLTPGYADRTRQKRPDPTPGPTGPQFKRYLNGRKFDAPKRAPNLCGYKLCMRYAYVRRGATRERAFFFLHFRNSYESA